MKDEYVQYPKCCYIVVRALYCWDVDQHQMSGREAETHYHSRLNEPPLVIESNLTTDVPLPPVE